MYQKLKEYRVDGQKVYFQYEGSRDGKEPCVEVISDYIFNVFIDYTGMGHRSRAIEGELEKQPHQRENPENGKLESVSWEESGVIIRTKYLTAIVGDNFTVDFYDCEGTPLSLSYRGGRKRSDAPSQAALQLLAKEGHDASGRAAYDYNIQEIRSLEGKDCIYGLGDKTGVLNKRHYEYEMWNSDIPDPHEDNFKSLYKSIPFMLVLKEKGAYGIFFDNHNKTYFDLGKESDAYYVFGADAGNLDYYFIGGESLKEVISDYTWLTGRAPMQQLWTLGFHQSRWGYESEEEIRSIAEGMKKHQLPCDCIHFDIDYMDHYKVFTWNQETYEDGAKVISDFKDMGIKAVTIIDPGVKVEKDYYVYEEGVKNGYFAKTPEGEIYVNEVWPGDAVYPDFGDPKVRRWWGEKQKFLIDMGVSGVWNDMNEPASFRGPLPDDVVFTDEDVQAPHSQVHNIYGHNMAKATYEGWKELTGKRPFVITRACYSGSQKYTTGWTGDNHSIWSHIRMAIPQMCNLGMSGMNFIGTDVGGFGSDCTPELFARWIQLGCFSPLFRDHCAQGCRVQEPWQFDGEVLEISRKYLNLRYELLPYLYDLMRECELTGIPMMRPLVLEYERDENVKNRNDEFMLGDRMLIAPVVEQGAREKMVYLPEGIWYDYWTGEKKEGKSFFVRTAPLDLCPIYVKAGAVIPKYPVRMHVGEDKDELLILEAYPGEGSYRHYQDNGEDFQYRQGAFNEYEIKNRNGQVEVEKLHEGYRGYGRIEIRTGEMIWSR
ncbi:MAG: DUF5110 domain-containing protein [Lachnospiraceae bacterium]|nr:DUF5110 domain-containing protein [Lachnospiraceae bacterium]